ncbi:hypothetical protein [Caulobacter sp. LARHSG274]
MVFHYNRGVGMRGLGKKPLAGRLLVALVSVSLLQMAVPGVTISQAQASGDAGGRLDSKEDLAKRYLAATHRATVFQKTYSNQLRLGWNVCRDKACQDDLDRAIDEATMDASRMYEEHFSRLLAQKLTETELGAALKFAESPEGKSIVQVQDEMVGDTALLAHTLSTETRDEVSRRFCPLHAKHCTADGMIAMPTKAPSR